MLYYNITWKRVLKEISFQDGHYGSNPSISDSIVHTSPDP